MTNSFDSKITNLGSIELPKFSGLRIMMLPLVIGDRSTYPDYLTPWVDALSHLATLAPTHVGKVGYLTIDEKAVSGSKTHRRAGLHVDGVFKGRAGVWGGGGWGPTGTGMLTVASVEGCRAWNQKFVGEPGNDGECDHLASQCRKENEIVLKAGGVYWMDGMCVHESLAMRHDTQRQFVRLSLPSKAPWFEGYTKNPLGVEPTGPILSRREYMDAA